MARDFLTDEQVEEEIRRLWSSDEVKLAKKEMNLKYKRRQYLYQLRAMAKRGGQLMSEGIDFDNIDAVLFGNTEQLNGMED